MAVVFADSYTVGADVNIEDYPATPDYSLMNASAGDIKVNAANDRVQAVVTGAIKRVRCLNAACPDGDQEASLTGVSDLSTEVQTAVLVRCDPSADDCYMARINFDSNALEIWSYTAGTGTLLATTAASYTSAGTHTYHFKATGTGGTVSLEAWIDALTPLTVDDSSGTRHTSGKAGFHLYNTTANTAWMDDFNVNDLVTLPRPTLVQDAIHRAFNW